MAERSISILKAIGNPNKARIVAHLAKHKGETAEDLSRHLGYPLPTVYKYLRELEAARMVESEVRDRNQLYYPGDFKLVVSPENLREMLEEQSVADVYRARFGDEGMERFKEVVEKVKARKMTFRQAASTLGMTYYEFVSILDETGAVNEWETCDRLVSPHSSEQKRESRGVFEAEEGRRLRSPHPKGDSERAPR